MSISIIEVRRDNYFFVHRILLQYFVHSLTNPATLSNLHANLLFISTFGYNVASQLFSNSTNRRNTLNIDPLRL